MFMDTKFTIKNKIVRESLASLSRNAEETYSSMLVGGIANQLYNISQPDLLRPTTDADISSYLPLTTPQFRYLGEGVSKDLEELGYSTKLGSSRFAHEIRMREDGHPFFIHIETPTKKYFERIKRRLEREHSDANTFRIPGTEATIKVVKPEDIITGKLRRLKYLDSEGLIPENLVDIYDRLKNRDFGTLAEVELVQWLENIVAERIALPGYIDVNSGEFETKSLQYKASKDLYDVSLLSRRIKEGLDFDEKYYDMVLAETDN